MADADIRRRETSITRKVAIGAGAIFMLAGILLSYLSYSKALLDLADTAEQSALSLNRLFANLLWPGYSGFAATASAMTREEILAHGLTRTLLDDVRELSRGTRILKVKLFDRAGVTGTFWPASAASTPTTYATAAAAVAQRPTTVATAPTAGTLTAATATSVYAGANGICQVAVANRDAAISMYCGQTSAVSATVGLPVSPGGVYTTSYGYGGALYCFPASGTPAYSIQVTSCP